MYTRLTSKSQVLQQKLKTIPNVGIDTSPAALSEGVRELKKIAVSDLCRSYNYWMLTAIGPIGSCYESSRHPSLRRVDPKNMACGHPALWYWSHTE